LHQDRTGQMIKNISHEEISPTEMLDRHKKALRSFVSFRRK